MAAALQLGCKLAKYSLVIPLLVNTLYPTYYYLLSTEANKEACLFTVVISLALIRTYTSLTLRIMNRVV